MAIIDFTHDKAKAPADAVWSEYHKVWTWKTHIGLCIKDREYNGYHDSDFYMTVWDEEKNAPREICFASTRGWSYPAYGSYVDATPEVMAKYEAYLAAKLEEARKDARKVKAQTILANRKIAKSAAAKWGFPYHRLISLRKHEKYVAILGLFNLRVRSSFKKSMRDQIVKWLNDPAPKYNFPLSKKQSQYLLTKEQEQARFNRRYY